MDTSKLKRFAPECREQLIEQVGVKLDYVLTTRTPDLAEQESLVKALQKAIDSEGRDAVIERVAYTWFNRLAALRYLDARGWHPFRMRVVTPASEDETQPELLRQVRQGVIPEELQDFVSANRVNDLLDGKLPSDNPQAEVQRLLVIGVCQYYAFLLPDLFERLDDFSRLLLPDDLLTEHSVVHGFQTEISDEDCAEVEVLGWLYQFYISEKKDAVMARKKAVPSEDIPAVTQLFTPHWIVRYLVENSLGRLWLNSKPNSRLRDHMPYFVADAPQVDSDQCSVGSDQKSKTENLKLNTENSSLTVDRPEDIRLLDPACGSGHMLTYAFDLLVKIYEEEGHASSEIPEKILTHNLFGLEICPRGAQLAQFALVCKAREQSRAAFRRPVQPQVMCLRDVVITADEMQAWCEATGVKLNQDELSQVHQFRENTQTFGSLIQPVLDVGGLEALREKIGEQASGGDLLVQSTHRKLQLVLDQAEMLSQRYQVVVANPPYMGGGKMNALLSLFVGTHFSRSKTDLMTCFMDRSINFLLSSGYFGMINIPSWMFLSSFNDFRRHLLSTTHIVNLLHLGRGVFGPDFGTVAFIIKCASESTNGVYRRLFTKPGAVDNSERKLAWFFDKQFGYFSINQASFRSIPSCTIAYWMSERTRKIFAAGQKVGDVSEPRQGIITGDNNRFLRFFYEVSRRKTEFAATSDSIANNRAKWFPLNKGGELRKWYGNHEYIIDYERDGYAIKNFKDSKGKLRSRPQNIQYFFREATTWSLVNISGFAVRYMPKGFIFNVAGICAFSDRSKVVILTGLLNSKLGTEFLKLINPTLNNNPGDVAQIPFLPLGPETEAEVSATVLNAIALAQADWDNFETSWDFRDLPLLRSGDWEVEPGQPSGPWKGLTLAESWDHYATYCTAAIRRMQELETENNRLWIDAYGLQDELTPEVPEDEITLARAEPKKDMIAFLSYAIGCMMGRYSLDAPGLILANAGDTLEDYERIIAEKRANTGDRIQGAGDSEDPGLLPAPCSLPPRFRPDSDGIIPITEDDWFEDDAASRVREFLRVTFGPETLEENVAFLEESLGKDLRKYFTANTGGFYADHVQTYKKRPIYWLFESPKKHFRALVYLHRYTKDTVNTLLNGYLREFHHKLTAKIGDLQHTIDSTSTSASDKTRAQKALDKAQAALRDVEEYERDILLPLAQQRLEIDLDDGVKANYPKFGKALAKVPGLS